MNGINTFTFSAYECTGYDNISASFPSTLLFCKYILYLLKAGAIVSCMFTVCVCIGGWVVGVNHLQCSPKCFERSQSCVYLKERNPLSFNCSCVLMAQCFCNRSGLLTKSTEVL